MEPYDAQTSLVRDHAELAGCAMNRRQFIKSTAGIFVPAIPALIFPKEASAQGFNGGGFNVGLGPFAASGGGTTTLDPANLGTSQALSNGNLTDSFVSGSDGLARSIANHSTGKYYCEFIYGHVGNNGVGIMDGSGSVNSYLYGTNHQFGTFFSGAWSGSGLLGTTTADSFVATNVGALALDIGN